MIDVCSAVEAVARELPGTLAVYLFGSFAEGREHAESDVDLGILLDRSHYPTERDRFDVRVLAGARLSDRLGRPADVVILNDAPPELGRAIVTKGKRIHCVDAEADHAYVRDIQLLAADIEPWLRRMREIKLAAGERTFIVERVAELRKYLAHLRELRPRVAGPEDLERDLSLHNDVLFSLLTVCQLVIDIAGELAARRGDRFETYAEAIRTLARDPRFDGAVIATLERLPGFRNVLVHEYVSLDMRRVIDALDQLDPIARFADLVAAVVREGER